MLNSNYSIYYTCVCVLKADFGLRNSFNNKIVVFDLLTEYALRSTANKSLHYH